MMVTRLALVRPGLLPLSRWLLVLVTRAINGGVSLRQRERGPTLRARDPCFTRLVQIFPLFRRRGVEPMRFCLMLQLWDF